MLTIEELAVAKTRCITNTLFFTRFFFKQLNGRKFVIGEHHKRISEALDRVYRGECTRLIINVSPRYGKTELAVKQFIAKGIGLNPKAKFIHLSYSDTLALDNSESVKDIINLPAYKQMFPNVKIKRGTDSKQKWYTSEGGGVYATSAGGQVTGFGAGLVDEEESEKTEVIDPEFDEWLNKSDGFGGAIIIDDPLKPEDAVYTNKRTKVNDRYDSTIQNRVNSRKTPIIIIMQRVHEDDLCGHVMKNYPGWEVLSLPVIKEDGSALWPFKHTIEELRVLEKANPFVFQTQMMQDPAPPSGRLFLKSDIKRFKLADIAGQTPECVLGYTDVADQGNDFFSLPIAKIWREKIFITDVIFTQEGVGVTLPRTAALMKETKCNYNRVESNNQGNIFIRMLRDLISPDKVLPVNNTAHKLTRILMVEGFCKQYLYLLDESEYKPDSEYDKFVKQIFSFMKNGSSEHDDAIDSISGLANFIQGFLPHLFKQ